MSEWDEAAIHQLELEAQEMYQDPDYINWLVSLEQSKNEDYYESLQYYYEGSTTDIEKCRGDSELF